MARSGTALRLEHDHRHEDGSADELTLYGGTAVQPGTAGRQEFPADEHSKAQFQRTGRAMSVDNVWAIEMPPAPAPWGEAPTPQRAEARDTLPPMQSVQCVPAGAPPGRQTPRMKIFSKLYDRALLWSRHPHAAGYLAAVSFTESSFFPVPPDVLLAPMTLAQPQRWWRLALLTTLTSVAGGILGYAIGYLALEWVTPLLHRAGYWSHFETAHAWFERYGFWAIFIAGFTPIPYKVFTVAAGAAHMAFAPFVLGSAVGRGARFFMVAALVRWGGAPIEHHIRRYVDAIGWGTLVVLVGGYLAWTLLR